MLKFFAQPDRNCQRSARRQFLLQLGSLAPLGLGLNHFLRQQALGAASDPHASDPHASDPHAKQTKKDVNCILIWTRGGTSHHDTFDPKPDAPAEIRGEFGVIDTTVPGIKFSDQIPNLAKQLNRYALVRSLNPKNGSHGTADAYMLSGHKFNPAITYPCFGSVVSKELGPKTALPPFMQLGTNVDRRFNGGLAGYLGLQHNAFEIPGDPNNKNFTVRDISLANGVDGARLDQRKRALQIVDQYQRDVEQRSDVIAAIDQYYENAFSMITSPKTQEAFDLDLESDALRDKYGRNNFGQSCLMARRMIESGVRFVTVSSGGWDTHSNNFSGLKRLMPPVDQGIPALLEDLEERGLLDTTLVVWLTDFGRTPKINSAAGRDHWSTAGFLCMAGAGVPGGTVVGATDAEGGTVADAEYFPEDVAATIYTKLGIPLSTIHHANDGRPLRLCEGNLIKELM